MPALAMTGGQREVLESLARSESAAHREGVRAKALLMAADGVANATIAVAHESGCPQHLRPRTGNPPDSTWPYSVLSGGCHGSRIAKSLVSDRRGWAPGAASMSSLCRDAAVLVPRWPKGFAAQLIRCWVSSSRRLFWSRSGPMWAGLRTVAGRGSVLGQARSAGRFRWSCWPLSARPRF